MARNRIVVPFGRLEESVKLLEADGIARGRLMYRAASCAPMNFDVELKVASSPLYVSNVLRMQERGAASSHHWRALREVAQ